MSDLTYTEKLLLAIRSVMTDDQLSQPLPGLNGVTTRMLAYSIEQEQLRDGLPARDGKIKAYWHPSGVVGARKFNAEWRPLVLGDDL